MAEKFISERNLKFLLSEVFDTPSLTQYPCRNLANRSAQAGGHSLEIIRQRVFHGSRRAGNQIFPLPFESAFPFRNHAGDF